MRYQLVILCALAGAGCFKPQAMRQSEAPPELPAEARESAKPGRCSPRWRFAWPGLGQICRGDTTEGATLAGLAAAQVATGVTVGLTADEGFLHPGAAYPLIGAVELYFLGIASPSVAYDLAEHKPYAPTESLGELLAAPVNGRVLSRPGVMLGLGMSALVAAAAVLSAGFESSTPNVFGFKTSRPVGYAAAEATWGALSLEAALGEEMLFRGMIQGAAMRSCGKWCGWAVASIAFGLAHIPGALLEPDPDFRRYRLRVGLPVVTLLGAYWGAVNIDQKTLTSSVAMHFWHNFLLLTTAFVTNPDGSPLAARVGFSF